MYIISVTPDIALDVGYTYAGGLGVLEGDKFYAAGDLGVNYIVCTLLYRNGYVSYEFNASGEPVPKPQGQDERLLRSLSKIGEITVKLRGEDVRVEVYQLKYKTAQAIFFSPISPDWAVKLCDRLYIEDSMEEKFYKYILLARCVAKFIADFIGVDKVRYVDLQEAYCAIVPLLVRPPLCQPRLIVHTPGPWGHPAFPRGLFHKEFGYKFMTEDVVLTEIGASLCDKVVLVSAKHFDVMSRIMPHHTEKMRFVTNGIHVDRWMDERLRRLYYSGELTLHSFIKVKIELKSELESLLRSYKPEIGSLRTKFVVAWCRRVTLYKRPYFMTRFIEENRDLNDVIFVLGGKAHPNDEMGLKYMREFYRLSKERPNVVYVHDYDVERAKVILRGCDLLTFTPFSGWEACGTSYMKAAVNGTPTLASLDGGVLEFIIDNVNGWTFGFDIRDPIELTDPRAREIDEREYQEFSKKLLRIYNMYRERTEEFYIVGFNALQTFIPRADIRRALKEYYPDVVKHV